jgi:hypothetical protein
MCRCPIIWPSSYDENPNTYPPTSEGSHAPVT